MTLEELIYKQFVESKELVSQLAQFSDKPAIFNTEPPEKNQIGWQEKSQYPQLVYNFDLQANEERNSVGTLSVWLYCQNTQNAIMPEQIEPVIRNCLKDVLLKVSGSSVYAFTWARTDAFEMVEVKNNLIIGSEIRFDILEYANGETTDPDPIVATNRYLKELYPDCVVVGFDRMQERTKATKEAPVIYCRLSHVELAKETNTVAWLDGKIAVHILCPDNEVRLKMAVDITRQLSLDGEITMLDKSPMFIKYVQMNNKSDYLKDGQIFISGRYGLLRYKAKPYELNYAAINYH